MNRLLRSFATTAVALGAAALLPRHAAVAQDASGPAAGGGGGAKPTIKALLVIGGCCHDYAKQKVILQQGISARAPVEFTVCHEGDGKTNHRHSVYEKPDWYKGFDVVIHDECSADVKDAAFIENILKAHKEGVPAVVLHCGMHNYRSEGFPKDTPWFRFTGLVTTGHGPQEPIDIRYTDKENPIVQGLADWTTIKEELYNNVTGKVMDTAKPLASGKQKYTDKKGGQVREAEGIVAWTNDYEGKAKVFGTTLGHNNDTVADARFLNLVTRGLLWSVGKLDEQHFKASDQNVDVKAIPAEPKKENPKKAASATAEPKQVARATPAGAAQDAGAAGSAGVAESVGAGCCGN